jgi:hypothetical protein
MSSLSKMFNISTTEITRRKLFRYASNDRVCEFISEPWEWLHEASSRVSDRIYNYMKNICQSIGSDHNYYGNFNTNIR